MLSKDRKKFSGWSTLKSYGLNNGQPAAYRKGIIQMTKKLDSYQKKLDKRYPNEHIQAIEYTGCKNYSKVKCLTCGKIFEFEKAESSYSKRKSCICKKCAEHDQRLINYKKRLSDIYKYDDIEVIEFEKQDKPCALQCKKCGKKYYFNNAQNACYHTTEYFCHQCVPTKKKQRDNTILAFLEYVNNPENSWILDDDVSRIKNFQKDKIQCICSNCGKVNNRVVYDYLYNVKCDCDNHHTLKSSDVFKKCLEDGYELLSDYKGIDKKVLIRHECGFCYTVTASSCWRGNGKCPKCHKKHSKGEKRLQQLLEKNNIDYIREYLLRVDGHSLRIDFYLPLYDLYVEYNGIQHYMPIEHFGGKKQLEKQQYYDSLKKKKLGNRLVIIRYDEDIEESFVNKILKFND